MLDLLCVRERGVRASQLRDYVYAKIHEFEQAFEDKRIPLAKDIPYLFGSLTKRLSNCDGYKIFYPEIFSSLLDDIYSAVLTISFDYLRLDYYHPFAAHVFSLPV